jgi:hypothetical protein
LKNYVFDIDGTICTNTDGKYELAKPLMDRIRIINNLYEKGNQISFLTARGMGRFNNNSVMAIKEFYNFTKEQLDGWGVKYHALFLGKPQGDIYIDDKGVNDIDFFEIRSFE